MTATIIMIALVLAGIRFMNSPKTAVLGNALGAIGITGAIVLTLLSQGIINRGDLWIAIAVGSALGTVLAAKAVMTKMPQMVALLNGFGGGASLLVALLAVAGIAGFTVDGAEKSGVLIAGGLAIIIGGVTFSGSLVAAGKLDQRIRQTPIILKGHEAISSIVLILLAASLTLLCSAQNIPVLPTVLILTGCSLFFGMVWTIRIGGADMPITISLLNSLSGLAASIAGLTIGNLLLVAIGAIVGAGGIILTGIMCRAMNRSLWEIIISKTPRQTSTPKQPEKKTETRAEPQKKTEKKSPSAILKESQKIIIIPGYGMALSQAQKEVGQLYEKLENAGKDVSFAIHPVAGRMPGHMNVLLAEAGIPYDKLREMDEVNPGFRDTDCVLIVGANDVVNSAARSAEGTPIYGMPVLNADEARNVIVCNKDTQPGYAGVDNPLYEQKDYVTLFLGDAKEKIEQLIEELII